MKHQPKLIVRTPTSPFIADGGSGLVDMGMVIWCISSSDGSNPCMYVDLKSNSQKDEDLFAWIGLRGGWWFYCFVSRSRIGDVYDIKVSLPLTTTAYIYVLLQSKPFCQTIVSGKRRHLWELHPTSLAYEGPIAFCEWGHPHIVR